MYVRKVMKEVARLAKRSPNVELIRSADIIHFAIKEFVSASVAMNVTTQMFACQQDHVMVFSVLKMVSVVSINIEESTSVLALMDIKVMVSRNVSSSLLHAT